MTERNLEVDEGKRTSVWLRLYPAGEGDKEVGGFISTAANAVDYLR